MKFSKRQKFIFLSVILTAAIWFIPQIVSSFYLGLFVVFVFTFLATLYTLGFDLRFPEHLVFPIYPVLLVLAAWLHRPATIHFSSPVILYTFSIFFTFYLLFLTLNILNIATIRTVPLKKAALSTFYFLGLIIGFFNIRGVLSLYPSNFIFVIFYFVFSFILVLPLIYVVQIKSSSTKEEISPRPKLKILEIAAVSLLSIEMALTTSFLRASPTILSIFLTAILFLLIGLLQHCVKRTLTKRILWEHAVVGVILVVFLLVSISLLG